MPYNAGTAFITVAPSFDGFETAIRKKVESIKGLEVKVTAKLDAKQLKAELDAISQKHPTITVDLKLNTAAIRAQLAALAKNIDVKVNVVLDDAKIKKQLKDLSKDLTLTITPIADTFQAEADINHAARDRVANIDVKTNTTGANAAINAAARNRRSTIDVDADTGSAFLKVGALFGLIKRSQDALNIRGVASNAGIFTVLSSLIPVLGPGALALAGTTGAAIVGSAGLGGLAASAIGNVSQITQAQTALPIAQTQQSAAKLQLQSANDSIITANQALMAAQEGVVTGENNLEQAQQSALLAQIQLTQARQDARRVLQDLDETLRGAQLAESGSKLAVEQATLNLRMAEADPNSTNLQIAQAKQALAVARLGADQAHTANERAKRDAVETRKKGVGGADSVVSAKMQLADAEQAIATAEQQRVISAQDLANAERQVARAHQARARALEAVATSTAAVAAAQKTLGTPEAKGFIDALNGFKDAWKEFLALTAEGSLDVVNKGLKIGGDVLGRFAPATNAASGAFGKLLDGINKFVLHRPLFDRFLGSLEKFGPRFITQFGLIIGGFLRPMLRLFIDFAPLAIIVGDGLVHIARSFDRSTWGFGKGSTFQGFIAFVKESGPVIISILGSLWEILVKLVEALAPVIADLLAVLAPLAEFVASLDPNTILLIAAALALLISPLFAVILGLAAAYAWFTQLYETNDAFKDWVDGIVESLTSVDLDAFLKAFEDLLPQLKSLLEPLLGVFVGFIDLVVALWTNFGDFIIEFAGTALSGVIDVVRGLLKIIGGLFSFWAALFQGDWQGVWDAIVQIVSGVWDIIKGVLKILFAGIRLAFRTGMKLLSIAWDLAWQALQEAPGAAWEGVKWAAEQIVNGLIMVLNALIDAINWLTKFVGIDKIPHVGMVDFSSLGDSTSGPPMQPHHMGGFDMAQGGVIPGWSPGRDVHHFVSATGGALNLSGGESVMVPEWTRAVGGKAAVDEMNRRARGAAYAGGGVFRPIGPSGHLSGNGVHDTDTGFPALDYGAPIGTPVHAVAPGRVTVSRDILGDQVGGYASYGRYMQVLHDGFETLYAHLSERLWNVGAVVPAGGILGLSGDTGHTYGAHLHHGVSLPRSPNDFVDGSTDYPKGLDALGIEIEGIGLPGFDIPNPFNYLRRKLMDALGAAGDVFGSPLGELVTKVPTSLLGRIAAWVKSKLGGLLGSNPTDLGLPEDIPADVAGLQRMVQAYAMHAYGWGDTQWPSLRALVQGESSWDPTAQNPTTSAYGLFQFLDATWATVGGTKTSDPRRQTVFGLEYIKNRYTDPANAYRTWLGRDPHWYDRGGLATGAGWMQKQVIAPERVLAPRDTINFERLVDVLANGTSGRSYFTITNWKDGTGYMTTIADASGAQRAVYNSKLAAMETR